LGLVVGLGVRRVIAHTLTLGIDSIIQPTWSTFHVRVQEKKELWSYQTSASDSDMAFPQAFWRDLNRCMEMLPKAVSFVSL
jgi:hypothetical protein